MTELDSAEVSASLFAAESGGDPLVVLEERVGGLVERHREALTEIEGLKSQLVERERETQRLRDESVELRRVRDEVLRRIDGLLAVTPAFVLGIMLLLEVLQRGPSP